MDGGKKRSKRNSQKRKYNKKRSSRKKPVKKNSRKKTVKKNSRKKPLKCWKGYVRVPGTLPGTKGSCRKK